MKKLCRVGVRFGQRESGVGRSVRREINQDQRQVGWFKKSLLFLSHTPASSGLSARTSSGLDKSPGTNSDAS